MITAKISGLLEGRETESRPGSGREFPDAFWLANWSDCQHGLKRSTWLDSGRIFVLYPTVAWWLGCTTLLVACQFSVGTTSPYLNFSKRFWLLISAYSHDSLGNRMAVLSRRKVGRMLWLSAWRQPLWRLCEHGKKSEFSCCCGVSQDLAGQVDVCSK